MTEPLRAPGDLPPIPPPPAEPIELPKPSRIGEPPQEAK